MSRVLSKVDGATLVDIARKSISSVFFGTEYVVEDNIKKRFSEPCGIFVTLKKHGKLRGCVGYARSQRPLYESVIRAAKSAAFQDTRFLPLAKNEFDKIEVEVSLLSEPVMISEEDPNHILNKIKVGKDGILIRSNNFSGIFLPQTTSELTWSSEELLRYACNKFGLTEMAWQDPDSRLYKFRTQVFSD